MKKKTIRQILSYFPKKPYEYQTYRIRLNWFTDLCANDQKVLTAHLGLRGWHWMSASSFGVAFAYWNKK